MLQQWVSITPLTPGPVRLLQGWTYRCKYLIYQHKKQDSTLRGGTTKQSAHWHKHRHNPAIRLLHTSQWRAEEKAYKWVTQRYWSRFDCWFNKCLSLDAPFSEKVFQKLFKNKYPSFFAAASLVTHMKAILAITAFLYRSMYLTSIDFVPFNCGSYSFNYTYSRLY